MFLKVLELRERVGDLFLERSVSRGDAFELLLFAAQGRQLAGELAVANLEGLEVIAIGHAR